MTSTIIVACHQGDAMAGAWWAMGAVLATDEGRLAVAFWLGAGRPWGQA